MASTASRAGATEVEVLEGVFKKIEQLTRFLRHGQPLHGPESFYTHLNAYCYLVRIHLSRIARTHTKLEARLSEPLWGWLDSIARTSVGADERNYRPLNL